MISQTIGHTKLHWVVSQFGIRSSIIADEITLLSSRKRSVSRMLDIIRDETDRTVGKRELHSARVRAAETLHIPVTARNAAGRAWGKAAPVPVDLNSGNRPIALAVPSHADAVYR